MQVWWPLRRIPLSIADLDEQRARPGSRASRPTRHEQRSRPRRARGARRRASGRVSRRGSRALGRWVKTTSASPWSGSVGEELVDAVLQLGRDAPERGPAWVAACAAHVAAAATAAESAAAASAHQPSPTLIGVRSSSELAPRLPREHLGVERGRCQQLCVACPTRPRGRLEEHDAVREAIVDSRCAMTRVVRCSMSASSAAWISCSTCTSMALVASSRIRTGGLISSVRAIAMRWRWPPERV